MLGPRTRWTRDRPAGVPGHERHRVSPHPSQVGEHLGDPEGQVALVLPGGGHRSHGPAGVHGQDQRHHGLALVALDDRLPQSGGGLPVDVGDIVPGPVEGHVIEVLAAADEDRLVAPVEQPRGPPQGRQAQGGAKTLDPRAAPPLAGTGSGCSGCLRCLHTHRSAGPHRAQGVGTAAKMASMIASGATPSARAS